MPSSGWPRVIGSRCGWLQPPEVTRPRARMTSRPPARSERSTSTLVTKTTGAGGPPTSGGGPPDCLIHIGSARLGRGRRARRGRLLCLRSGAQQAGGQEGGECKQFRLGHDILDGSAATSAVVGELG